MKGIRLTTASVYITSDEEKFFTEHDATVHELRTKFAKHRQTYGIESVFDWLARNYNVEPK